MGRKSLSVSSGWDAKSLNLLARRLVRHDCANGLPDPGDLRMTRSEGYLLESAGFRIIRARR